MTGVRGQGGVGARLVDVRIVDRLTSWPVGRSDTLLVDPLTRWPEGRSVTRLVDLLNSWPVGQREADRRLGFG
jgi:hypothetical protein